MKRYGKKGFLLVAVLLAVVLAIEYLPEAYVSPINEDTVSKVSGLNDDYEAVTVLYVVDGDTLKVDYNGTAENVRLIGVDCPESVNPDESKNSQEGREASDFTKSIIKEGQVIYLQKDISDTDRYGRLLRYVWLEIPTDNASRADITAYMLNAILVEARHAIPKSYAPDTAYQMMFESF